MEWKGGGRRLRQGENVIALSWLLTIGAGTGQISKQASMEQVSARRRTTRRARKIAEQRRYIDKHKNF